MKVKELIAKLLGCNPNFDVAYEHCYVDYCEQKDQEKLVEMGDLRPFGYTRWRSLEKWKPEEQDYPIILATRCISGDYTYTITKDISYLSNLSVPHALWMPVELTPEDNYRRLGYDEDTIQKLLATENNG